MVPIDPGDASAGDDPDLLRHRIWQVLTDATQQRSPFALLQVATVGLDRTPRLRTVVLRGFDPRCGAITFITDRRSSKVAEIAAEPRVAVTALDGDGGLQLRLEGDAGLVDGADSREELWRRLRPHTRGLFGSSPAPGTPLTSPSGPPSPHDTPPAAAGPDQVADGPPEHFAVVRVVPECLDWLDVSAEPHRRCRFTRDGDAWPGQWIAP